MATWHLRIGRRISPTAAGTIDDALLAGLRAGEGGAFERLYADHAGSIYNVSLRILRSPEDAEDVTQEVFIKAYRRLPGCEKDLRLKAWLNRVAVNACYDHLRSRSSHADLDAMTARASQRRLDALEQAELGQVLEQALDSLSLDQRTVLLLKDLQGLTQEEIASVLGVSESAAESRLFRARSAFRRAYSELTRPWQRVRCDLARVAAVDSVGRGLSARQRRRILRHAETCPDCGETVKSWGGATVGLAVLLPSLPLPAGLAASPFGALGAGAAGGGIAGGGLAAAGATGVGSAGAGAGGVATGAAATVAGGLAAKAAVVVIVAGALTASAGLATHQLTAPQAHGRVAAPAAGSQAAKSPGATLVSDGSLPGSGHRPPAAARRGHANRAKAGRGAAEKNGKAPGKALRGRGKHAPAKAARLATAAAHRATKAAHGSTKAAHGKGDPNGHANGNGGGHPHGSSKGSQGHQGKAQTSGGHGRGKQH